MASRVAAAAFVKEVIPKPLDSTSEPPSIFDGTTRLYVSLRCPYAQRVWFLRNFKDLQDNIKLVPINLADRPAWYKEKVYPTNRVPALEHNNKVIGDIGETLNLLKYTNTNFEGPLLLPNDPAKQELAEELLAYSGTLNQTVFSSFKGEDPVKESGAAIDHLETALGKFDDGPYFLGQFSLVDIAYAPFIESMLIFIQDEWDYDIEVGRPKLAEWLKELNTMEAYTATKLDPEELLNVWRSRFRSQ